MRKTAWALGVLLAIGLAGSAFAAEFQFHGDLNNRFMVYTDQARMFRTAESISSTAIDPDGVDESWGEIKYRIWFEAATDDGKVKGVYGIELGALRFGNNSDALGNSKFSGGAFSGDGINVETRWAYTDFQLPGVESKARISIGLIPFSVNKYVWQETAMGVQFKGAAGPTDLTLAWVRGREDFNNDTDDDLFEDLDALLARVDFKAMETAKVGLFALYQGRNPGTDDNETFDSAADYEIRLFDDIDFDIYTLGIDGSTSFGNLFLNWDLIYQGGSIDDSTAVSRDVSAFFAHADVGVNLGPTKLTYTVWYASGDDNPNDEDVENFMSTDVDTFDSIIFFEGGYTDDSYFTEAPYILDKGLFFNKLALDYKATDKLKLGLALLYLQTAEDLANGEDALGTEVDAYLSYKLYSGLEFAWNIGYLVSDDGMLNFGADEDVLRSTARVRYGF